MPSDIKRQSKAYKLVEENEYSMTMGKFLDNRKLLATLEFFVKLLLFAIPLYVILIFNLSFGPLQAVVRDLAAWLIGAAGMQPTVAGSVISIPLAGGNWGAAISWDCTGWKSMLVFLALVFATPRSMRDRAKGLAIFLPLIFIVNIVRIAFMFYFVQTAGLAYFDLVHAVIWSWGLIAVVLVCWLVWLRHTPAKVGRRRKRKN
jgi:exosortase/archaeosortase family protein